MSNIFKDKNKKQEDIIQGNAELQRTEQERKPEGGKNNG